MVWKACPSGRAGPLVRSGTQSWRRGPVSYEAAGRPGRSGPRAVMGSAGVDSARTRAGGAAGGPLRPPGWLHGCPAPQAQEGGQEAAPEARTATEGTSWGPGAARGDTAGRPVPAGGDPGRRGSGASLPFQCPSLFLVPFTQLLGIPVPVAAQRVSSSFLSSPRLFFFFF